MFNKKEFDRQYSKEYNKKHPERVKRNIEKWRKKHLEKYRKNTNESVKKLYRQNYLLNKKRAVRILGNKCSKCGYNKHLAALDFHHCLGEKDISLGNLLMRKWSEKIEKEIRKCILLCANCHRELHFKNYVKVE